MLNQKIILHYVLYFCLGLIVVAGTIFIFGPKNNTAKNIPVSEEESLKNGNNNAIAQGERPGNNKIRPIDASDHVKGNLDAPIQFIIYSDFECPFCAKFTDSIKQVEAAYGDKVVIAFRHFPLRSHTLAIPAAIASECASEQGKFWEMHDKLFDLNKNGKLSVSEFPNAAVEIGLDAEKFSQCTTEKKYEEKVLADLADGRNNGVTGTPANFINGEVVPGAYPFEDFTDSSQKQREGLKSIIERQLKAINK